MCVLSIKVPIQKKFGNLFNDSRIYILGNACLQIHIHTHTQMYIYIYIYVYSCE